MMWKESYRIGVEIVDEQHRSLFEATERLLNAVKQGGDNTAECIQIVLFLKDYAVKHFAAEEAYLRSIHYAQYDQHRVLHKEFIATLLSVEKDLIRSEFSPASVGALAGFLTTWLVYHVAGEDRKFKGQLGEAVDTSGTLTDCFIRSASSVLHTLTGAQVSYWDSGNLKGDVLIEVSLTGDADSVITFSFPQQTAFALLQAMTSMEANEVDEIVQSALSETANIIAGNAASLVAAEGAVCDITTPKIVATAPSGTSVVVHSELGDFSIILS